jgi:cell division protein ZipA
VDGLRWLLLLFGLLVIVGVYWYSRREQSAKDEPEAQERVTPTLDGEPVEPDDGGEAHTTSDSPLLAQDASQAGDADDAETEAVDDEDAPQKIVALRLVARERGVFAGDELVLSLRGIGMRHGKFGIFHRLDGNDERRTVFSAASLVEPGSFDLSNIKEQEIPGISLFLVLPGPVEGAQAFDMMMDAARTLAQSLDGELLDESGSTLSIQRERYMREEIVQFEHSHKVA